VRSGFGRRTASRFQAATPSRCGRVLGHCGRPRGLRALFGSSSFIGLTLLTLLLYGALGVLVVLVPYVLIEAAAYSGTAAGAALLPFAVVLALVSPLLGRLSGRIGARVPLSVGSLTTRAVGVNPTFTSPTEIAVSKRGGQTWTTHPASSHW
jgi:hypothetical protein